MELQHDPKTKQQIKETLYTLLYRPVLASCEKKLKSIIERNAKVQNAEHPSFTYRGEVYVPADCITAPPMRLATLATQLRPEMDAYLKEVAYLNSHELPYVLGYINQVLNASNALPDYVRLLPDSLHHPIQKLIAACPRKATMQNAKLEQEDVEIIRSRNTVSIELMRKRLALNLLL